MKLTVFAASGGVGRQLLDQALAAGHEVTAVVRDPAKLGPTTAAVVAADLATAGPAELRAAVAGADAVLSGLGPVSKAEAGVAWRGTTAIVQAMRAAGVRRIVAVSAAPVGTVPTPGRPRPGRDPGDGAFMSHLVYPVLKRVLREHYADVARMEEVLRESGLDWTAVRPVQLNDRALTGGYRSALDRNLRHGRVISRADVAHAMLAALAQPETVGRTVGLAD
ncbi:NAD(P)-dependent oxidoreductase [Kitasatospora sp. MMS16-BH015]|uniref:NAD(P)-dependent oxidoreductase n=1 Tax=Kitasatospora sp. MMS16-BH015 TaxID=2018025 RepID=UPI000CF23609|nr:NAD(P)H-binding protein [Kitasatospora sp. MMS16-BH015]